MRDKFSNFEHFDEFIKSKEKFHEADDHKHYINLYLEKFPIQADGFRKIVSIESSIRNEIQYIPLKYSRGDSLSDIVDTHLDEILLRYEYFASELAKGHPKKCIYGYGKEDLKRRENFDNSIHSFLAWCICLGADHSKMKNIAPYIGISGEDRLIDLVCAYFKSDKEVSDQCGNPEAFYLLEKIIDTNAKQRPKLVKEYLDNWPKTVNLIGGNAIGVICNVGNKKIKSKADMLKGIDSHYRGFWAWEVALVTKFFHIDDSSYKDHYFYPYDLVHFTPPLDNQAYLSSIGLGAVSLGLVDADPYPKARLDLVVLADKDPTKKITAKDHFIRDEQHHYIYQAYHAKTDEQINDDFNAANDSAIHYSVSFITTDDEIAYDKGLVWNAMSIDAELGIGRNEMKMHDFIDELGTSELHPSMQEVHLYISGDKDECSWLYCSRHKENKVPPMMIIRHVMFTKKGELAIECIVKDPEVAYSDVSEHWQWLVNRYQDIT